jgi:hypothetical protein
MKVPHGANIVIIALLILFLLYRRIRRTIGFQRFVKGRMMTRMALFGIICIIFLALGYVHPLIYVYDALGIVIGGLIAYFAIRSTTFEWRKGAWYFRPNPWIGALLLVLFIGRIGFRVYQDYALISSGAARGGQIAQQNQLSAYSHDPFTVIILFTLISYYFVYYTFIIRREQHLEMSEEGHRTTVR